MNIESTSISVSTSAIKRIQGLLPDQQSNFFRVYVTGGGCSGFQYGFKFDDNPAGDDDILDFEGFTILFCLLYTSPSPRDGLLSRMPSSA